jgi:hypothetical protein
VREARVLDGLPLVAEHVCTLRTALHAMNLMCPSKGAQ